MIKFLHIDVSGNVPCPRAENPMLSQLRGVKTIGGSSLAGKFPEISLVLNDGDEVPPGLVDYFRVGLLHVVSAKLKAVLASVQAELEYFPVNVFYHKDQVGPYFVAHPLKRFKAIDYEKSDVVFNEELGIATTVRKLVIDESKFIGVNLAVVAEIQRIGVSSIAVAAINASGCIGCTLLEPLNVRY